MPPRARPAASIISTTQSGSSDDDGNPNSELTILLAKMEKQTLQRRSKARIEIENGFNAAINAFVTDKIAEFNAEAHERQRLRAERLKLVMAYVKKRREAEVEIEGLVGRLEGALGEYVGSLGAHLREVRTGVQKDVSGEEGEEEEGKDGDGEDQWVDPRKEVGAGCGDMV